LALGIFFTGIATPDGWPSTTSDPAYKEKSPPR
jgi:hypothetical protein